MYLGGGVIGKWAIEGSREVYGGGKGRDTDVAGIVRFCNRLRRWVLVIVGRAVSYVPDHEGVVTRLRKIYFMLSTSIFF